MADRLLAAAPAAGAAAEDGDALASRWHRIAAWFPPAVGARILAPLIPVYDAGRDALGFYRFVLEWPQRLERKPPLPPPRPLGYETIRRLLARGALAAETGEQVGVVSVRYAEADRGALEALGCAAEAGSADPSGPPAAAPDRAVEIVLARRAAGRQSRR